MPTVAEMSLCPGEGCVYRGFRPDSAYGPGAQYLAMTPEAATVWAVLGVITTATVVLTFT
jgi:hypothetical protein